MNEGNIIKFRKRLCSDIDDQGFSEKYASMRKYIVNLLEEFDELFGEKV